MSRTGGTARDHGPPVLLPEVRRNPSLPPWGNGRPAAFTVVPQAATVPGQVLRTLQTGFLQVGQHLFQGRQESLLFSSGSEVERMVSVWRRCVSRV